MEKHLVDKEVADKHYIIVGQLHGLEAAAKACNSMPCDMATAALLAAARMLIQHAINSAWEYAESNTASAGEKP